MEYTKENLFKLFVTRVNEEIHGVQNLVVDSDKQIALRTKYCEGLQEAVSILNKILYQ